jgi:hypothetical protein
MKSNNKTVTLKQNPEEPIAVEIIVKAIMDISENMRNVLSAGLTKEAIVTLVHAKSGVGKTDIRTVIDNLADLRKDWCSK